MSIELKGFRALQKIAMPREVFNALPDASITKSGALRKIFIGDRWYAVEPPEILLRPIEIGTFIRED